MGVAADRRIGGRSWLGAARARAQRRIQERGRRAEPDPRGLFSTSRNPFARMFVGRATARRCVGLGTATSPGTRASGEARPTGVLLSVAESVREDARGSSNSSTLRGLGRSDESRNAGVGQSPTHGGSSRRLGIRSRGCSWVEQQLDAAWAWVQGRNLERGRRAKPDPRGFFSALRNPFARTFVGRAMARRFVGPGDHSQWWRHAEYSQNFTFGRSETPPDPGRSARPRPD